MGGVTYGLADQGDLTSVNYPAISYDGGRRWAIDGPIFYIAAADGVSAVNTIAALSPTTAYAWGSGNFIRWTTNGGRQWWGAFFSNSLEKVSFGDATIYPAGPAGPTYTSNDGGRTWTLKH
ncbi:MAG TPA: hypothetical protein VFH56_07640 [Acidimicrobiales bacterium]|nr:hypothetical protein [Acidimicrobiales bacterium]